MEALRNLRDVVYDLIDLRSIRDEAVYENVGPPRPQADQAAPQMEAAIEHGPPEHGPPGQGRDQG